MLEMTSEILSIIFAIEAIVKIIALGFWCNGKKSYLKNIWNKIDFLVVVLWISNLAFGISSGGGSSLKVIRVVRVVRPLRLLKTAKGLQLGINTIIQSFTTLISLVLITFLVFSVMGIFAQGYLKGRFYHCDISDITWGIAE